MENKSLIALVGEAASIEQMLIESGGEITEAIEQALAVKETQFPQKVDNYAMILERFEALEKLYKEKASFFAQIGKQFGAAQDRLKENLKYAMNEMHTDELKGHDVRFKLSKAKAKLIIDDESMVPVAYKNEVISTVVDKEKLRDDLELGEIKGAHLEPSFTLRKYANTNEKASKKAGA